MSSKRELREAIRQWAETTFAISRQRDEARAERDDIRDQLAQAIAERDEVISELSRTRELAQARADLDADLVEVPIQHTTPEPRPFRVGDRVRVAEGATYRVGLSGTLASRSAGRVGVVREVWSDGDLIIDTEAESGCAASPEFCTLIEAESESQCVPGCTMSPGHHPPCCICGPGSATCRRGCPDRHETTPPFGYPAATISDAAEPKADTPQSVTLTLPDGTTVTFDAVVTR